ncbi:hypothetical protein LOD99_7047 [Oopsacas minuta]|uniref:Transposase Tc1-like domain-containing protein n=1 Tax=Oopsacas minuta TaxID=111878 RepID=A0AAV7JJY0_9METZ|nr:hypothetical protein LOD99_7047 [Oopsacas minuta]
MVIADPNVTYERIQHEIGISSGAVHTVLHQSLQLRKLCARWIPHQLHPEQKQNRVKWCHEMLTKFKNGTLRDISKIITDDETWIYHYDPETKQQSRQWLKLEKVSQQRFVELSTPRNKCMHIF